MVATAPKKFRSTSARVLEIKDHLRELLSLHPQWIAADFALAVGLSQGTAKRYLEGALGARVSRGSLERQAPVREFWLAHPLMGDTEAAQRLREHRGYVSFVKRKLRDEGLLPPAEPRL